MSEMRALTNLVGNGVATIVVAIWEGEFDRKQANRALNGEVEAEALDPLLSEARAVSNQSE
jgi:aerobic C4-dicarboxylate transport protein